MNFQIENMPGANKQIIFDKSVWQSQEIWNGRQEFYNSLLWEENLVLFPLRGNSFYDCFISVLKYRYKPMLFIHFAITFLANK